MKNVVLGLVIGYFFNTKEGRQYLSSSIDFMVNKLKENGFNNERRINETNENDKERVEITKETQISSSLS